MKMGVILITHDLGIIAKTAQSIAIMYAGKIVEYTHVKKLFSKPLHPYTQGLLKSIPKITTSGQSLEYRGQIKNLQTADTWNLIHKKRLQTIPGMVPNLSNLPPGCNFAPRCQYTMDICKEQKPPLKNYVYNHLVSCWKY